MTSHKSLPPPPPPSSDSSLALSKTTDNDRWSEGLLRTDTSEMSSTKGKKKMMPSIVKKNKSRPPDVRKVESNHWAARPLQV